MVEKTEKNAGVGHRARLREKYLETGIQSFHHDYEKLEFLLSYAIARKDVKPIAKDLIEEFRTIENIMKSDIRELQRIEGIAENTAIFLKFIGDLHKTSFREKTKNEDVTGKNSITSKNDLLSYLRNEIGFLDRENFIVLFLDSANRVIDTPDLRSGILFEGTLDRSVIYAREILKKATEQHRILEGDLEKKITLKFKNGEEVNEVDVKKMMEKAYKNRAKSVIFAHNHPSGNLKPSRSDIEITREMKEILKQAEIRLLDHIIISKDSYFSFLEEGLIEY